MNRVDALFSPIFSELASALKREKARFASGFEIEDENAKKDVLAEAEKNKKTLTSWRDSLRDLNDEMSSSGLLDYDSEAPLIDGRMSKRGISKEISSRNVKPLSVTVLGEYKPVRYWKDILLFVCEVLYEKQPLMFANIENEPSMQGRKGPYISTNKRHRKSGKIEGSQYYVEVNLSQSYCIKISEQLLLHCGYKPSDLIIEKTVLSSDGQEIRSPEELEKQGPKVGQRARYGFAQLLSENRLSPEDLKRLCQHEYSKRAFGALRPVLRMIQPGQDADEIRLDHRGRPRYYKEVYQSNGNSYLIYSQWYKKQVPRLEAFLSRYGL